MTTLNGSLIVSLCVCVQTYLLVSHSPQSPLPCPVELLPPPTSSAAGGVESPPSASLSPSLRSLGLSVSVWPLSPRASPYSHPQSHVMTLGLTHLGRGHIPYSAPRIYYIECATWHRMVGGIMSDVFYEMSKCDEV